MSTSPAVVRTGEGSLGLPVALERAAHVVQPALDRALERLSPEVRVPVAHHLATGGKRVRAALVLVTAAAAGAPESVGVPGAVAIELVHNFSLLHDDIIDGDTHRRHRSTVWAEFGVGRAIIAGDALAALATQVLLDESTPARVRAAALLASATQEMIAGQADDMAFETRRTVTLEEALAMASAKTGALLSCAAALGAVLADAPVPVIEALADFGRHLGVAFQAIDDVLGIWGDPARTGKPIGTDLIQHKKTLPVAIALSHAEGMGGRLEALLQAELNESDGREAARLIEECEARTDVLDLAATEFDAALGALERVELVAAPKAELLQIAHFVTERDR